MTTYLVQNYLPDGTHVSEYDNLSEETVRELIDYLVTEEPGRGFKVFKNLPSGGFAPLRLPEDRDLMRFVKDRNREVCPRRYVLLGFDRDTGRGNYRLGTFDDLHEVKWRIDEINAAEGEDAPLFAVGVENDSFTYEFLDPIDEETVEGWGL